MKIKVSQAVAAELMDIDDDLAGLPVRGVGGKPSRKPGPGWLLRLQNRPAKDGVEVEISKDAALKAKKTASKATRDALKTVEVDDGRRDVEGDSVIDPR